MVIRRTLLVLLPLLIFLTLRSQQFGGIPHSLKWNQIKTDTARIIFPRGMETRAEQVATIIHELNRNTLLTIGNKVRPVNIVFQNQTTISNGYVQLAPFRSEFELMPEQNSFDLGSLPWQQTLAIHEYRHVQQFNNFRVGLSKAFYILFGEGGLSLANSLAIPNWFFEGDAVFQETLVSEQGRGRLPYFFNGYRSLWNSHKNYSWLKLRNGSLRDQVPDHYPLGYILVAYGREKYGDDFWKKVTFDAATFKGLFYPLQKAIKKYSGISFVQFRNDAIKFFSAGYSEDNVTDTVAAYGRNNIHFVANEEFPHFTATGKILMVNSSYKKIPRFIIRDGDSRQVQTIKFRAISIDNYYSFKNDKIVYAAFEPDPRWGWRDYSVIRMIDLKTNDDRRITSRSKYFAPDISADGSQIVAVHVSTNGESELQILDAANGQPIKTVAAPNSYFYTYPKFFEQDKIVTSARDNHGAMSVAVINIANGGTKWIIPFSMNTIGFNSVSHDTIFFTMSYKEHDEVFAFSKDQLYRIDPPFPNHTTGNYQFVVENGKAAWTGYTAVGYKIMQSQLNDIRFTVIDTSIVKDTLSTQGIHSLHLDTKKLSLLSGRNTFGVSKYPASYNLLNFHSWRPYINDPDYNFSLVSENVLNTLESELFIGYNRNEKYKQAGFDATYAALYPWIDGGFTYTFDRNGFYHGNKVYWNELEANAGLSVPLNFSRGVNNTNLQFGTDLVYSTSYFQGNYKDSFDNRGFAYINAFLSFTNSKQQARQQIYPSLAQTFLLNYRRAVTTFDANQFLASANFYLPAIAATHSLVVSAAFQQRDTLRNHFFSNGFPFSRGYSGENFFRMYRLAANYHFPICYPDAGLAGIVYFSRIRANVFYDYSRVFDFFTNGNRFDAQFRSAGTEIYFDTKWWNQLPISLGLRYSRLLDPDFEGRGPNQFELILPINLLTR